MKVRFLSIDDRQEQRKYLNRHHSRSASRFHLITINLIKIWVWLFCRRSVERQHNSKFGNLPTGSVARYAFVEPTGDVCGWYSSISVRPQWNRPCWMFQWPISWLTCRFLPIAEGALHYLPNNLLTSNPADTSCNTSANQYLSYDNFVSDLLEF